MSVDLKGKRAIVTGGSRGLGAAIVTAFEAAGAEVFAPGRDFADLSNEWAADDIIDHAESVWPSLDILVNNAAIQGPVGPSEQNNWQEWIDTLYTDLVSPVRLSQFAARWMKETSTHGSIVNISGGGATSPRPNYSAYATAKCGLVRFSETLAAEVAEFGIRVNCVAPGKMKTGMSEEGDDPAAAAQLVAYLASDASFPITGKLISAKWDPWSTPESFSRVLAFSEDMYTLRRMVP